ncbi:DEAD/DEAH box helicase [Capnocytophaga canimorsus]|nr:DEAD/DEAH box helicase [Capnocytophaga canimorsus]WGU71090.1 DEAD/DEAH box helicase [Capnocytophaga canimorsus]
MTETPLEILKKYWGYDAFRSPQADIVQAVLEGKNVLALMPTGGGKSIAFQVPALLKSGICIVVSPLIALINDQVEGLKKTRNSSPFLSWGTFLYRFRTNTKQCCFR